MALLFDRNAPEVPPLLAGPRDDLLRSARGIRLATLVDRCIPAQLRANTAGEAMDSNVGPTFTAHTGSVMLGAQATLAQAGLVPSRPGARRPAATPIFPRILRQTGSGLLRSSRGGAGLFRAGRKIGGVPRRSLTVYALAFVLAVLAGGVSAPWSRAQSLRETFVVKAVRKTRDSIVAVRVERKFARRPARVETTGAGVLVDERGYIVTNRHVVGDRAAVDVRLADGRELLARVILADAATDVAVLKVQAGRPLPALALAPGGDLLVGEPVVAVGHPFGYENTVSTGIISGLGREIEIPNGPVLRDLIQTNVGINPGNSGGPLLNADGEWIGVNVALRSDANCIAFAINADTIRRLLARRLSAARLAGVSLGLTCKEELIADGPPRQRVRIAAVVASGPGAAAGLKTGDELAGVGGRAVANLFDVERALWDERPGRPVELKVVRGGQELTRRLTLAATPGDGRTPPARTAQGSGPRPQAPAAWTAAPGRR